MPGLPTCLLLVACQGIHRGVQQRLVWSRAWHEAIRLHNLLDRAIRSLRGFIRDGVIRPHIHRALSRTSDACSPHVVQYTGMWSEERMNCTESQPYPYSTLTLTLTAESFDPEHWMMNCNTGDDYDQNVETPVDALHRVAAQAFYNPLILHSPQPIDSSPPTTLEDRKLPQSEFGEMSSPCE